MSFSRFGVTLTALLAIASLQAVNSDDKEPLYQAKPITAKDSFTGGIEGPACDTQGNVFAVNFARQGTIGKVTPKGEASLFIELPEGSVGNGIRFDQSGNMYIADYPQHNVLRVDAKTGKLTVFAHNDKMNQPNDLAIDAKGNLYASDPNWGESTGQLWRISNKGKVQLLADGMGTTNGIEVSPNGKHLYVNESVQRNVWSFDIAKDGTLSNKKLLRQFPDFGFDGMRCDIDGNLYITRHGKGTVVIMSPEGKILEEIDVLGSKPSNICFGGPDGKTCYVTEMEYGRLVSFRVARPGVSWKLNKQ